MKENEKFDDFYLRLYTIVNQAAGVGYTFDQITVVRKIIRVIPRSRFGSKIDAIVENTPNMMTLTVQSLASKLRAYEAALDISQTDEVKKDKRIAFSSLVEEEFDEEECILNENDLDKFDEEIAFLSQKVKKMMNFRK
jgi:hypothetical protein